MQVQSYGPALALSEVGKEGRNAEDHDYRYGNGATVDPCIVNLDEVTFIDKRGEQMLRSMSSRGTQFVASDVYVNHVLDRLKRKSHRY